MLDVQNLYEQIRDSTSLEAKMIIASIVVELNEKEELEETKEERNGIH